MTTSGLPDKSISDNTFLIPQPPEPVDEEELSPQRKKHLWTVCPLILGNEFCERLAYYGVSSNMVMYLKLVLGYSNADASARVAVWSGTCYLTPLIGAYLADAYLGRFAVILVFSLVYFVGLLSLTLSASLSASSDVSPSSSPSPAGPAEMLGFWLSMYLIALGTGGIKPCVSSFGADQFLDERPLERRLRSAFFNYFYFAINLGSLIANSLVVYVQQTISWPVGFAIPAAAFALAIGLFLSGARLYRRLPPSGSPLARLVHTLRAAAARRREALPPPGMTLHELTAGACAIPGSTQINHTKGMRWLDRACVSPPPPGAERWLVTVSEAEEVKAISRLLPFLATNVGFQLVYNQMATLFVLQGEEMNTQLGAIKVPAASMSVFNTLSVIVFVLLYDRLLLPALALRGRHVGLLLRIGLGYGVAVLAMASAAVLEAVPQYTFIGLAEVLSNIGILELFYSRAPAALRSVSTALALTAIGLSGYATSALIATVQALSSAGGGSGWIGEDLNASHLDYYFWLLAGLQVLCVCAYVGVARVWGVVEGVQDTHSSPPPSQDGSTAAALGPRGTAHVGEVDMQPLLWGARRETVEEPGGTGPAPNQWANAGEDKS